MELLILLVAFTFWVIKKVLTSSEQAPRRQKHRPPKPAPWRDPWGEMENPLPIPDFPTGGRSGDRPRRSSPSAVDHVKEGFQKELEAIEDALEEAAEEVQKAKSRVESAETDLEEVQPPLPALKRKKTFKLEERLFNKRSLVQGIILQEILGPPPSRRHFYRSHRRIK